MNLDRTYPHGQQVKNCCRLRQDTNINVQNGAIRKNVSHSICETNTVYLTEKRNAQQAKGNAAETLLSMQVPFIVNISPCVVTRYRSLSLSMS